MHRRLVGFLGLCLLLCPGRLLAQSGSDALSRETRFASRNAVEKVCLTMEHTGPWKAAERGRFRMASSNCTIDRDFVGSWLRKGDTLVLNTDRRPRFSAKPMPPNEMEQGAEATQEPRAGIDPGASPELRLALQSDDPMLMQGLRIQFEGQPIQRWQGPSMGVPAGTRSARLLLEGMDPVVLNWSVAEGDAGLRFALVFEDLYTPALVDDRWLLQGSVMRYVPRPGSVRTEAIELKKGKRCWYKP
jgi:hypothetical protein